MPLQSSTRMRTAAAALVLPLIVGLASVVQVSVSAPASAAASGLVAEHLTTNGRTNPLGIPGAAPSFGWSSTASARDVVQSAYQVRVATSASGLESADVWDSGKVTSDRQVDVAYAGPELVSQTRYVWQVRVWDGDGEASAWSEPGWFETGLLDAADWGDAEWIGAAPGTEIRRWTDYTATFDFTMDNLVFAAFVRSETVNNGYMWQLSVADGTPRFRPHRRVNGGYALLDNKNISSVISAQELRTGRHTMSVTVDGSTITTRLDGVEIDRRTDTAFGRGYVGFRTSQATEGTEAFTVHHVNVVDESGSTLLDTDFTAGNPFTGGTLVDDGLAVSGNQDVLWRSPDDNLPLLRTDFATEAGKTVEAARVYATARGVYELSLNGEKVGDQHLAPGWTDYHDRIQHQTYDVTDLVRGGVNAFGAELGRGWWAGKVGMWGPGVYGNDVSLLARLRIDYSDGTTQWVDSGDDWTGRSGPYVAADNIDGETYDARNEAPGWDQPGYDDSGWAAVVARPSATQLVVPQPDEPVRTTEELSVVERTEPTAGTFIYDVGQNMVGVARMRLTGVAGTTVRIRYGEVLNPDGTLYTANLRAAKVTDFYTFAADGTVTYEPKFTQHGFRYVEVTGAATPPAPEDVTGVVWGSDLPATGTLDTSSAMLNQLASNISWGERGNFLSIPTDTPARDERLGWTGDINVFAPTASYLRDTRAFLTKWMTDMRDAQRANGDFPGIAPVPPGVGCCDGGTGWADAGITVPYTLWHSYGDATAAREFYPEMQEFLAYVRGSAGADLIDSNRNVYDDWLNLDDPTPAGVLGTAYFAEDARMMSEMAAALGKDADAATYAQLSEDVRQAFANAFVAPNGTVSGNSQTAYAMALGMDLVPAGLRDAVGDRFVAKLAGSDNHLTTGFLGTPWLLPALSSIDRDDLAYTMLMHEDYPSWGYEVAKGATTMWERWNSINPDGSFGDASMNSFNHYAYGAVGDWMYQHVGGLRALEPGYRRSAVSPTVGGGLISAEASLDTVYGTLASSWRQTGDGIELHVTVPVNTTAEVNVPADSRWAVTEGGAPAADVEGVRFLRVEAGAAVFEVGSGEYDFAVDRVLGSLGDGRDGAAELVDVVSGLDAPGVPATRSWADHIATSTGHAWTAYVAGDPSAAAADVHRALAFLGDVERWTQLQVEKGRLSEADGDRVRTVLEAIEADLSAASGGLLGATATVEIPVQEWFPGSTVPLTVTVANGASTPLTSVAASFTAGDGWQVVPAGNQPTAVEAGETLRLRYDVRIPTDATPGPAELPGSLTYKYRGSSARLPLGATITVEPPVVVRSVAVTPAAAEPGEQVTTAVELANRTDRAASGEVALTVPEGWDAPSAAPYSLAAGETATVELAVDVPLSVTEGEFTMSAAIGDTDRERGSGTGMVRLTNPPPGATDRVDLGNATSEAAHGLTASPTSGTNVEAGLTRRYTNNSANTGWFEVDVAVPANQAFVIRAIETYNMAQVKTYDVLVDGTTAVERRYTRRTSSAGTMSYQFAVQPSAATSDGRVRLRFQDVPGEFDPSIADIWAVPVG
jgi:alpha-L-rhamnosidase